MSKLIPILSKPTRSHAYLTLAAVALVAGTAVSAYALIRLYRGNVVVGGPVVTRTVPAECPAPAAPECPECGRLTYADAPEPLPALPAGWTYSVNAGEDWLLAHPADWEYVEDSEDWRVDPQSFVGMGGDLAFRVTGYSYRAASGYSPQDFDSDLNSILADALPLGDNENGPVYLLADHYPPYGYGSYDGQSYLVKVADDRYFRVGAYALSGSYEPYRPTVEKVVRSLRAL
jgi:hypothetical protein